MNVAVSKPKQIKAAQYDRIGIAASILCAIHCAATPVLLLLLPTFGEMWAHPATHWGMAIVVVPLAVYMMVKGYRQHSKKWVLAVGGLGVLFILAGAALPYMEAEPALAPAQTAETSSASCNSCCPSVQTNEAGEQSLHIPPASIVTTLGGICLIAVHAGNLCLCSVCRKKRAPAVA